MMSKAKTLPCGRELPGSEPHSPELTGLLKQLDDYVTGQSLNRSDARRKILETIVAEAHHFTARDLLERLNKRYPEVGKATLYRNLPVLVQSGILQEGPTDPEGQTLYELAGEHHDHIFCLDCQRIFEFHDEAIEARQEAVTQKLGFNPRTHRHVIYASCELFRKLKRG